jgi:hypothetical protein
MSAQFVSKRIFLLGIVSAILISSIISACVSTQLIVSPQGATGADGPQGSPGPTGAAGSTGPQGPQGPKGDTGDVGPQGLTGTTGPQGPPGPTGPAGATGPQGTAGVAGPQGLQGTRGLGFESQGNISVSHLEVSPFDQSQELAYSDDGVYNPQTSRIYCFAPVHLPNGVIITNATFYYYDADVTSNIRFYLIRQNQTTRRVMGFTDSDEYGGYGNSSLLSVSSPVVDNINNIYSLRIDFPDNFGDYLDFRFQYALIEYRYPP